MPKLTSTIRYLEAAARALESRPTTETTRNSAIVLLAQAGLTTRAISEILGDYGQPLHFTRVAAVIRNSAPELPL